MPMLDTPVADTTPVVTAPPAADTPPATTAERPADAMVGAADKLFDNNAARPEDVVKPPVVEETPEQKAAREATETPEQKAAREAAEAAETPEQKAEREKREAEETPEQKAEREKAEAKAKLDAERYGAPDGDYEFKAPDGVTLDPTLTTDAGALAKELDLSPASAQKIIDLGVKMREQDAAQLATVQSGWVEASKADKEFGGDKLNASLAIAQKALKEFGTPELQELMVGAKLGDHPEIIRLMTRVGTRLAEAPVINGAPSVTRDAASVLYPNHPRKQ